jgi:hypothetical protein
MTDPFLLRKMVVRFLRTDRLELFEEAKEKDWRNNLRWLDRSGLALPLAARFEALRPGVALPDGIRAALQSRLLDNQRRMERMLGFFEETTRALTVSGVQYCCVKGFSLIPDCFDGIRERHQVDLDFLVAPQDSRRAQCAIEGLGYRVQRASVSGETRFIKPWNKHLGADAYLYVLPEPPPIELHTRMWEPEVEAIDFPTLSGFFDAIELHEISGVQFPRLRPAHQFVFLLLHIFRHLLGSWVRLLSLYEVATLILARSTEGAVWTEVSQIIGKDTRLASACALVLGLVDQPFSIALPQPLREVCLRSLSTESALWMELYSTPWLFADPPGSKLALLVQKQFCSDHNVWQRYLLRRLLPLRRPHALSDEATTSTKKTLIYRAADTWYKTSRLSYHLRSDCEYLIARLQWERHRQTHCGPLHRVVDEF